MIQFAQKPLYFRTCWGCGCSIPIFHALKSPKKYCPACKAKVAREYNQNRTKDRQLTDAERQSIENDLLLYAAAEHGARIRGYRKGAYEDWLLGRDEFAANNAGKFIVGKRHNHNAKSHQRRTNKIGLTGNHLRSFTESFERLLSCYELRAD